jgi:hypothetical protein
MIGVYVPSFIATLSLGSQLSPRFTQIHDNLDGAFFRLFRLFCFFFRWGS